MGRYVNPVSGLSPRAWLESHGVEVTLSDVEKFSFDGSPAGACFPVCLVQNAMSTYAAIAYNPQELKELIFLDESPRPWYNARPGRWYIVSKEDLEPFLR